MPMFRSRNHFRVATPRARFGPLIAIVLIVGLAGGAAALALLEPSPPVKHFEVPVSKG